MTKLRTQRDQAIELLRTRGMMRLSEFKANAVTAATIGRMVRANEVSRLVRGLYQLPDVHDTQIWFIRTSTVSAGVTTGLAT